MLCSIAKLGSENLESITTLEQEIGKTLLAFSCHDMKPAELSDEQLARIQKLEKELGMSLVAVGS